MEDRIEKIAKVVNQHSRDLKKIVKKLTELARTVDFLLKQEERNVEPPDFLKDLFNK